MHSGKSQQWKNLVPRLSDIFSHRSLGSTTRTIWRRGMLVYEATGGRPSGAQSGPFLSGVRILTRGWALCCGTEVASVLPNRQDLSDDGSEFSLTHTRSQKLLMKPWRHRSCKQASARPLGGDTNGRGMPANGYGYKVAPCQWQQSAIYGSLI